MNLSFKLTIPKPNEKWWNSSKAELLQMVKQHHEESWSAEQDPVTGQSWQPRQEPTGRHPILRKSGKMLGSTKFKAQAGHPMLFSGITKVNYGKYHQEGTSRLPRRRWLGLGSGFADKFDNVIAKHIFKGKITFSTK